MSGPGRPPGVQVSYRRQYRRCGKTGCAHCAAGGPGHGPYWYAYWWQDGRAHSRYVGKQAPAGVGLPIDPAPAQATTAALRVRTLGGFAVWRGAAALGPERWRSQRASTLFKCLLSAPGHRLLREQAVDLLWPEGALEAGAGNLRTTIHLLRQVLDAPQAGIAGSCLRTEGATIALAPAGAAASAGDWLDADVFACAAQAALAGEDVAACRAALACYGGEYLPDDLYEVWAEPLRAALRRQYLELLLHLATLSGARGALAEAEDCLRGVLATEPGHEAAAATLMSLLAESGRRDAALRVYQALATVLEEELDLAPAAEIVALRARVLAQGAAPTAATAPARPAAPRLSNLPAPLTSFVGRTWELTEAREALAATRLLTLLGPGGCGKTRLALEVAARLVEADAYPDGVWLVELAALADPAGVARAVAAALGLAEQPGQSVVATLVTFLQPRHLLLVLDNCEHLIAPCAKLAAALLAACPHLRLLATSREALDVPGEHTYLVPSLTAPDPAHLPPPERLPAYEAVQLFLERARVRQPELRLTAANAGAVAQVCARLDGLPLALELAAARVGILSVEAIAARLDDRFRLLTGGPRTALPRQQTLRATLDWSHELLGVPEQVLLRRLAVFAGGGTLEAAVAVCADDAVELPGRDEHGQEGATPTSNARLDTGGVLDVLSGLVHKSLLLVDKRDQETRYRLLETVRQYGQEKLEAAGEAAMMRGRHLDWYVALGEQAAPHFADAQQLAWLDRLEREHDNLRAALRWSQEDSEAAVRGVELAAAIWPLWALRGYLHEGRRWLEAMLAQTEGAPAAIRARALYGAAELARDQGDYAPSATYGHESLALYREVGDLAGSARVLVSLGWGESELAHARALGEESLALARRAGAAPVVAQALGFLGNVAIGQCDLARAQAHLEEGLALVRALDDTVAMADVLNDLGQVALFRGAYERADTLFAEALALQRELGNALGVAVVLCTVAETAYCRGETARALDALEECMELCRALGHRDHLADALNTAGRIAWRQGDAVRATALLEEALSLAHTFSDADVDRLAIVLTTLGCVALGEGDHARAVALHRESLALRRDPGAPIISIAASLEGLAMALAAQGQAAQAAWQFGVAAATRDALDTPLPPLDRADYERVLAATRAAMGDAAFAAAWTAGQAATLEQAIAVALAQPLSDALPGSLDTLRTPVG